MNFSSVSATTADEMPFVASVGEERLWTKIGVVAERIVCAARV